MFVGGQRGVFERWRGVLDAVLPRPVYVGEAGQAMVLKLVANLLVALHSAVRGRGPHGRAAPGLDLDLVLDALGSGAASSRMLEVPGPLIAKGEFPAQMKLDPVREGPPSHPGGGDAKRARALRRRPCPGGDTDRDHRRLHVSK